MTLKAMTENLTVFIVDDDPAVRDALSLLLGVQGYRVAIYGDAESFLKAYRQEWRGGLLLDIPRAGVGGLALPEHLLGRGHALPVIVRTGPGDVASAREAFRALAVDFLEKPLDHKKLLAGIAEAFSRQQAELVAAMDKDQVERLLSMLTPRELEVMHRVVAGLHNREIAAELGISPRTVEVHKARMMDKLGVGNVADLVRLNLRSGKS